MVFLSAPWGERVGALVCANEDSGFVTIPEVVELISHFGDQIRWFYQFLPFDHSGLPAVSWLQELFYQLCLLLIVVSWFEELFCLLFRLLIVFLPFFCCFRPLFSQAVYH